MKAFLIIALLLFLPSFGRSADPTQTLLKTDTSFPAAGGPGVKVANFEGQTAFLLGGSGELLLGDTTGLGVASYSLSSGVSSNVNGLVRDISFSYVGVTVDDFFVPHRLFFLDLSTLVGAAFATGSERNELGTKDSTTLFVVEPEFDIMLNVTKELRLGFGLSYRLLGGADTTSVMGMDFSGFAGTFSFMYGK